MHRERTAVVFWLALAVWLLVRLVAAGLDVWVLAVLLVALYQAIVAIERWLAKVRA